MSKLLWLLFFNSYIFIFLSLFFFGGGATAQQVGSQFSAQGSNPRPLHWKLEFQPLDHERSPKTAVALIPGSGRSAGEGTGYPLLYYLASLWLSWYRICLQCGRPGINPWVGRSPGEGKGYPLQYPGLENSMDCIVHGVTKSQTRLSDFHFT